MKQTKMKIAQALDDFGVEYIELTSPAASPESRADCEAICKMGLKNAKCVAPLSFLLLSRCCFRRVGFGPGAGAVYGDGVRRGAGRRAGVGGKRHPPKRLAEARTRGKRGSLVKLSRK